MLIFLRNSVVLAVYLLLWFFDSLPHMSIIWRDETAGAADPGPSA